MSEQSTKKSKIGARKLTEEEAGLILPTYDQIYSQIGKFRREKSADRLEAELGTDSADTEKKLTRRRIT